MPATTSAEDQFIALPARHRADLQEQQRGELSHPIGGRSIDPTIGLVVKFVAEHEFARSDFPQSGYNVHRLSRDVTQLLLHNASLPLHEIEGAAEWMLNTIERCGAPVRSQSRDGAEEARGMPVSPAPSGRAPSLTAGLNAIVPSCD